MPNYVTTLTNTTLLLQNTSFPKFSDMDVEELSYRLRWWSFPDDLYTVRG